MGHIGQMEYLWGMGQCSRRGREKIYQFPYTDSIIRIGIKIPKGLDEEAKNIIRMVPKLNPIKIKNIDNKKRVNDKSVE